jgi:SAM-dependent methyltransferase
MVAARDRPMTAYEGIEDPSSFRDPTAVRGYRAGLLRRTAGQADFLVERAAGSRVLEVGCGNGRLLIELARRDSWAGALGIDIASSRIAFAREWARAEGCEGLEFAVANALEYPLQPCAFGAAVCITGAFAYFEPMSPGAALLLAQRLYEALAPGGLLCLELYPHPSYRHLLENSGGEARIWTELPPDDPWRFYLSRLSLDDTGEILQHEKTFIHRVTGEVDSGRQELLYLYSEESIRDLLGNACFREINMFEGWSDRPYSGGEAMVVTALR